MFSSQGPLQMTELSWWDAPMLFRLVEERSVWMMHIVGNLVRKPTKYTISPESGAKVPDGRLARPLKGVLLEDHR